MSALVKEIKTRQVNSNLCVFGLVNEITERESLTPTEGAQLMLEVI